MWLQNGKQMYVSDVLTRACENLQSLSKGEQYIVSLLQLFPLYTQFFIKNKILLKYIECFKKKSEVFLCIL